MNVRHDIGGPQPPQHCLICKRSLDADAPSFPFCSVRCRNVDLGNWFDERYRFGRSIQIGDEPLPEGSADGS